MNTSKEEIKVKRKASDFPYRPFLSIDVFDTDEPPTQTELLQLLVTTAVDIRNQLIDLHITTSEILAKLDISR